MWVDAISFSNGIEMELVDGFEQETINWNTPVQASIGDVTRSDETVASQRGYTADVTVTVSRDAYNGQSMFRDESTGDVYDIRRHYHPDKSRNVQLIGQRRNNGRV